MPGPTYLATRTFSYNDALPDRHFQLGGILLVQVEDGEAAQLGRDAARPLDRGCE